jgi:hypothetical protein
MLASGVGPATRVVEGLRLTTPADEAACAAMIAVNSKAYGMDLEGASQIVGNPAFWRPHFPIVAVKDGAPAACAAVMMVDGHRYVALVATDPAQQRRGYADAAMRQAATSRWSPPTRRSSGAGTPTPPCARLSRLPPRFTANGPPYCTRRRPAGRCTSEWVTG